MIAGIPAPGPSIFTKRTLLVSTIPVISTSNPRLWNDMECRIPFITSYQL